MIMAPIKKGIQCRVRLAESDEGVMKRISQQSGLAVSDLLTVILYAGIQAIKEENNKFPLPLRFKICKEDEAPKTVVPRKA
jgi:hypothetical protein